MKDVCKAMATSATLEGLRTPVVSDEAKVKQVCEAMHQHPTVLAIQAECLEAVIPLLDQEDVRWVAQKSALGHAVINCLRKFPARIDLLVCTSSSSCVAYCFRGFCLTTSPISVLYFCALALRVYIA